MTGPRIFQFSSSKHLLVTSLLIAALAQLGGMSTSVCVAQGALAGKFAGDDIEVTLIGSGNRYTGTILTSGTTMPLTAEASGNTLTGSFETDGTRFDFTAHLEGDQLTLTSGGQSFVLRRQGVKPLKAPSLGGLGRKTMPTTPTKAGPVSDAKSILQNAYAAMGGKAAYEQVRSIHMKAHLHMSGDVMLRELYRSSTGQMFVKQTFASGEEMLNGFDGKVGWSKSPWGDGHELVDSEIIAAMKDHILNTQVNIFRLEQKYEKIDLVGTAQFDGKNCHKLSLVDSDEPESPPLFAFFDAASGLPLGTEITETAWDDSKITTTTKFQDWRQVGNLKFAHVITMNPEGVMQELKYDIIELDSVSAKVFALPAEVKRLAD